MGFTFYQIGVLENFPVKIVLDLKNLTVKELIEYLSQIYRRDLEREILETEDQIKAGYLFILNGVNISDYQGLDTLIPEDSQLLLSVLMAGG